MIKVIDECICLATLYKYMHVEAEIVGNSCSAHINAQQTMPNIYISNDVYKYPTGSRAWYKAWGIPTWSAHVNPTISTLATHRHVQVEVLAITLTLSTPT